MGEILYDDENELTLFFDDDGEDLRPSARVLVNDETEALIGEIDGERSLVGFPKDEIVYSIQLMEDEVIDWPDKVD